MWAMRTCRAVSPQTPFHLGKSLTEGGQQGGSELSAAVAPLRHPLGAALIPELALPNRPTGLATGAL